VDDLIALVAAVDGLVRVQAAADVEYFVAHAGRSFTQAQREALDDTVFAAYRWQYILSGVQHPHFVRVISRLASPNQLARISRALVPLFV